MEKFVAQLNDYFQNTSQEQLDKDFEELREWNDVGSSVEDYLRYMEEKYGKQERE